jgi:hypothetical protein
MLAGPDKDATRSAVGFRTVYAAVALSFAEFGSI